MGQNAFVERYDKPNYRLHVVLFLAILAISLFLATQVEKTKENADIAAFKNPVPIDSISISKSEIENNIPTIKTPVVNKKLATTASDTEHDINKNSNQEYVFDDGSSLENINQLLASEDKNASKDMVSNEPKKDLESGDIHSEKEASLEAKIDQNASMAKNSMDTVYDQQQDRFLQTLAKSAELESKESIDIKKLKEAIRSDKPLVRKKKESVNAIAANASKSKSPNNLSKIQKQARNTKNEKPTTPQPLVVKAQSHTVKKQVLQKANLKTSKIIATRNVPHRTLMTKRELDSVVSQFARSYNEGDITRLMALFTDNASTNDQKNKTGIKADYAELFSNTQTRKLMIKDVKWHLSKDKAEGAADFVVTVQPKNSLESNLYKGYIKITAIKQSKGVYITRLIHELKQ